MEVKINNKRHIIKFTPEKLVDLLDDYGIDVIDFIQSIERDPEEFIKFHKIPKNLMTISTIVMVISDYEIDRNEEKYFHYFKSGAALVDITKCWNSSNKSEAKSIFEDIEKSEELEKISKTKDYIAHVDAASVKYSKDFSDWTLDRILNFLKVINEPKTQKERVIKGDELKAIISTSDEDIVDMYFS